MSRASSPRRHGIPGLSDSPGPRCATIPGLTWREFAAGAGGLRVGEMLLGEVVALSAVGAAAVLYSLGWLLDKVLVVFPHWIAGLGS